MSKIHEESAFVEAVKGLIGQLKQLRQEVRGHLPISPEEFKKAVENYDLVFSNSEAKKHYAFYRSVLNNNKAAILTSDEGSWITAGISIRCSLKTNVSLEVSMMYQRALHYAETVRAALKDLPTKGHTALVRPEQIRYQLLKALAAVAESDEDRKSLNLRIATLEKKIQGVLDNGLPAGGEVPPTPAVATPSMPGPEALSNVLGGVLGTVTTFLQNSGIKLPPGPQGAGSPLNAASLSDVFKNITESGALKGMVESMMASLSQTGIMPGVTPPAATPGSKDPLALGIAPVPPIPGTTTTGIVETDAVVPTEPVTGGAPPSTTATE